MPDTPQTALDDAVAAVPAEQFHGTDGRAVRPCTPAHVTHRHLRMLDIRPGANVLEIGIGSGYSAALLAHLAGPGGTVTALEIDPDLAKRAEALYAEHGHDVTVVTGDGLLGYPAGALFDRILVGATPPAIPDAWLKQLKPGGILLCGARLADLPGSYGIARITVDEQHRPETVEAHHGGYTPMTGPPPSGRVTCAGDPHNPDNSLTVLGDQDPRTTAAFLAALLDRPHVETSPVPGSDYFHLKNWILATAPDGLLEATVEQGTGVGLATRTEGPTFHVAVVTDDRLIADSPGSPALEALRRIIDQWDHAHAPHTNELMVHLVAKGGTWQLRLFRDDAADSACRPTP